MVLSSVLFTRIIYPQNACNDELIEELGVALGDEFILVGAAGCYGPAFNIHRSPLNGRNSEYYSEDSFLTGKVAAANTRGLQAHGLYVYAKHYAAYAVSSEASFCSVWLNEQALREIYVKAFEMAVKEGQAQGIMCSYTGLGTSRNVMDYGLLTQLPRNEWGFRGVIISDAITSGYDYDLAIRTGLNLCLNPSASTASAAKATEKGYSVTSADGKFTLAIDENGKAQIKDASGSKLASVVIEIDEDWGRPLISTGDDAEQAEVREEPTQFRVTVTEEGVDYSGVQFTLNKYKLGTQCKFSNPTNLYHWIPDPENNSDYLQFPETSVYHGFNARIIET